MQSGDQEAAKILRRFEMVCSRCVMLVLVLHVVMDHISAAILQNRSRTKREVDWLDQEIFSDPSDVPAGDAEDVRRDGDTLASQSETAAAPTAHVPVQNQHQNQNLHIRRASNRLKVTRLDPIGRFKIPTFHKRKEKTNLYRED